MKQTIKRSIALVLSFVMMLTMVLVGVKDVKAADVSGTATASQAMYSALILDLSGSMSGQPINVQKDAAKLLVDAILNANPDNKVALLGLESNTKTLSGFTSDKDALYAAIDSTRASGNTNMEDALKTAGELLNAEKISNPLIEKEIILCSDGLPQRGKTESYGQYTSKDHWYYTYGNACFTTASELKNDGVYIVTVGMFHALSGNDYDFGKRLMEDLASPERSFDATSGFDPKKAAIIVDDINDLPTAIEEKVLPYVIPDPVPVITDPTIVLSTDDVTLYEGETVDVTATLLPADFAAENTLDFFVDNIRYASVEEQVEGSKIATITGVEEGETYMYAVVAGMGDNPIAVCHITVKDRGLPDDVDPSTIVGYNDSEDYGDDPSDYIEDAESADGQDVVGVSFADDKMSITVGNSKELPLITDPADLDYANLVFTSSDDSVAEIDENIEHDSARVVANAPGKCTITVADKKGGSASATISITVVPKKTELTALTTQGKRKMGFKWKIAEKAYCDGYQIQYSSTKDFSSAVKKIDVPKRKTTSTTIRSSIKSGRTMFVRIRVYKNIGGGKKVYSAWSKVRSKKVK